MKGLKTRPYTTIHTPTAKKSLMPGASATKIDRPEASRAGASCQREERPKPVTERVRARICRGGKIPTGALPKSPLRVGSAASGFPQKAQQLRRKAPWGSGSTGLVDRSGRFKKIPRPLKHDLSPEPFKASTSSRPQAGMRRFTNLQT